MEMPIRQKWRVELYRTLLRAGPLLLEICGACNVRVVALGVEEVNLENFIPNG